MDNVHILESRLTAAFFLKFFTLQTGEFYVILGKYER